MNSSQLLGGGDATKAKQDLQTAELQGLNTKLTTLLAQTDAVEGSLASVDGKVATQTTLAALLAAVATEATLAALSAKLPALLNGRVAVEPLGQPGVARQLAAGAASVNTALTSTCRRASLYATEDIRFLIGSASQTAAATSHFIAKGERLDVVLPATPNIGVIRAGATSGTLEVMELL